MEWKNPDGSLTNGVVIEDGSGNKITSFIGSANLPSLASTGAGTAAREVITDPASGAAALVTAFHNSDNQAISGTSYGLMTGGVAQLVNASGNLDRQRETGFDGLPATGIAAGSQQMAGPPLNATLAQAVTLSASAQTVTLNAVAFVNRGVTSTFQVGSSLQIDSGANQEIVFVTAVNSAAKTIAAVFTKNHSSGAAVLGFAYNQARDATIPDGSTPSGIAASAAYFFNAPAQTVEMERSAAGELDGASGTGTAVAAEYEWNGGGPLAYGGAVSGLAFDRARNLQAKGAGASTLNGAVAAGATSLTVNAVAGLQPGQQIRIDRGQGVEESAYVVQAYTPGSLTVALQSALANAHGSAATVEWDVFASAGPGLNGFTPAGIGIEEEALYDPVSGKYYIERAATQDNCPPQNVVLESLGLWNGTGMDRLPGSAALGAKVQMAGQPVGSGAFATALASVGTSATQIVAARAGAIGTGRIAVMLYNNGSQAVFIGGSGVTSATGLPLGPGGSLTLNTTAAVYGVTASGTVNVGALETY